jgi:hypothetical protein
VLPACAIRGNSDPEPTETGDHLRRSSAPIDHVSRLVDLHQCRDPASVMSVKGQSKTTHDTPLSVDGLAQAGLPALLAAAIAVDGMEWFEL